MRVTVVSALLLGAIFFALALLSPPVPSLSETLAIRQPRLVILYATCSLNKNYLSPYNSKVRFTPGIGSFARDSIVFSRHQTEVGFSGPAFASLFSGMNVYHHGVYYHPAFLKNNLYLMAEAFRDNDYDTFYWNAHEMASPSLNYAQGVRRENIINGPSIDGNMLSEEDQNFSSILWRLRSSHLYKAFIQTSFTFTHSPYSHNSNATTTAAFCRDFPEECKGIITEDLKKYLQLDEENHFAFSHSLNETARAFRFSPEDVEKFSAALEASYKSSVHILDTQFGQMIKAIKLAGLFDDSLIIFTSDHGEMLYRKDVPLRWTHWGLEPEVLGVPLILHLQKKVRTRRAYGNVTRSMDLLPTLIGLSHLIIRPYVFDGKDLSKAVLGEQPAPELISFSCSGMNHPATGAVDPRTMSVQARKGDITYRLIPHTEDPGESLQMFDLRKNGQIRSLAVDLKDPDQREIFSQLREYRKLLVRHFGERRDTENWDEVRERLRALGYIQ